MGDILYFDIKGAGLRISRRRPDSIRCQARWSGGTFRLCWHSLKNEGKISKKPDNGKLLTAGSEKDKDLAAVKKQGITGLR